MVLFSCSSQIFSLALGQQFSGRLLTNIDYFNGEYNVSDFEHWQKTFSMNRFDYSAFCFLERDNCFKFIR